MYLLLPTLARCEQSDPDWTGLLARADRLEDAEAGLSAQLAPAFGWRGAAQMPWAAILAQAEGVADDQAQPARWIALEALSLRVAPNGIYVVAAGDFGQAAAQMQQLWALAAPLLAEEGLQLLPGPGVRAYLQLPSAETDPGTLGAEDLLGAEISDWMPGERVWRRRLNELQICWSQHPLNQQRIATGQLPINSAWFSAASACNQQAPQHPSAIYSQDPLLHALREWSQTPDIASPTAIPGALLDLREDSSAALSLLRSHHPRALLHFACGARYALAHWHRLRFWRGHAH